MKIGSKRISRVAAIGCVAAALVVGACASGGDDDGDDASGHSAEQTSSVGTPAPGVTANATADANASPARGTPGAQTPSSAGNTPITGGGNGTPAPGSTPGPSGEFEATVAAEAGGDIAGGDPSQPQQPVGDVPTPPPGATVDDDEIAPPNPPQSGMQVIVDMDATTAGIQPTRSVSVGDVIKVAIVGANLPSDGIAAFNFSLDYDKTKVVAPSYTGGSSTDRNPDFNNEALGDGWTCLPAPEGDVDDEGGINGDGNPATGSALLSCFIVGSGGGGTLVMATVEFHAVAAGNASLSLNNVAIIDNASNPIAYCDGDTDTGGAPVPCVDASMTVQ